MANKSMKMFVWQDVLCDYTCGMAVVYARNLLDALAILLDKAATTEEVEWFSLIGEISGNKFPVNDGDKWVYPSANQLKKNLVKKPIIFDKPNAIAVYGGS